MNEIKSLLKAQQELKAAQDNIPSNIKEAAEKLSEKTGIDYYGALEIIDMTIPSTAKTSLKTKIRRATGRGGNLSEAGRQSIIEANKKKKGFGGRINPKNLEEIKQRHEKHTGDKKDCYKAAYELFKRKGKWIPKKELQSLGVNVKVLRNKRKVTPCLPVGYILRSSSSGYMAYNIKESLQEG